jgi:adenosine deaminase
MLICTNAIEGSWIGDERKSELLEELRKVNERFEHLS